LERKTYAGELQKFGKKEVEAGPQAARSKSLCQADVFLQNANPLGKDGLKAGTKKKKEKVRKLRMKNTKKRSDRERVEGEGGQLQGRS